MSKEARNEELDPRVLDALDQFCINLESLEGHYPKGHRGLTARSRLARKAGVSPETLRLYAKKDRVPTLTIFLSLVAATNTEPSD